MSGVLMSSEAGNAACPSRPPVLSPSWCPLRLGSAASLHAWAHACAALPEQRRGSEHLNRSKWGGELGRTELDKLEQRVVGSVKLSL